MGGFLVIRTAGHTKYIDALASGVPTAIPKYSLPNF
jgi:hypothetical protein